ncbi:pyridoxal phosphate-dependent aminotransferase [Methanoplanus endosymbiosus]|uniref:histidinol-phosphate transaminase n=1 Tax=Methanoplanus endosymbiosus TaxID=33865 RepID=A0A9E7PKN2_9EURY|nr:histidinol-phosphate transaminase [Methanoplanus endosymbiosus]UUX91645.1 aminotransferase class I/II-fold pyridoxal phosphate-dependent enzyme [Methanoplanus endosymbiosus]
MRHLIRDVYSGGGYVFATKAADIARSAGYANPAKLASNENPYPPFPNAVRKAYGALEVCNRYPDEKMRELKDALAARHGDYTFVTGVGMDGVIETTLRALIDPGDRVSVSVPTFSFYGLAVRAQGGEFVGIGREDDFTVDPEVFIRKSKGCKLSFLCSPNNPSGTVTPPEVVAEILEGIDGLLFLDNAYVDFCDTDYRSLMKKYDNLIIGMTMSKAYGLAGMRVGYAFIPEWFEEYYNRAQTPFVMNSVSAAAAAGALEEPAYIEGYVSSVREWRKRFETETRFKAVPGGANFVMFDVSPYRGDEMVEMLAEKGVIVRSCTSFPGLGDNYIRVSIGEDWECERFLEVFNPL